MALERLGPDFTYRTTVYATKPTGSDGTFSVFVNGAGSQANPAIDRLVEGFVLSWAP